MFVCLTPDFLFCFAKVDNTVLFVTPGVYDTRPRLSLEGVSMYKGKKERRSP